MKKYKLDKKHSIVSDKDIEGFKDFSKFKANYEEITQSRHKKPLYKNPKLFFGLLLFLLILWLLLKG